MQFPKKRPESLDQVAATIAAALVSKISKPTPEEAVEAFYAVRALLIDNAPAPAAAAVEAGGPVRPKQA
jgi:hypothetical protein